MIVLVCGATIGQSPEQNPEQIEAGIRALLQRAEATGIKLAIEPLHPMYAGDRSAVASLRDANNGHLFAFHICEFKPDFDHPLLDRGLPSEGVNSPNSPSNSTIKAAGSMCQPHKSELLLSQRI